MKPRTGSCLLVALVVSVASGCAGAGVSGDDYALVANPPGKLRTVTPGTHHEETDRTLYDIYNWTYSPGGWPAASLVFIRIKNVYRNKFTYIREASLADHIKNAFTARDVEYGRRGITKNVLGQLRYQHFRVEDVGSCVYVEQGISRFADQVELDSGAEPLGDMVIRGWYCAQPKEPDRERLFREFIASIGIYGFAVPPGT